LFMVSLGSLGGVYVIYLWQKGTLNPNRPLMTLMVLLIIAGIQILLFGFLGTQLVRLRKEIYKVQRENKNLEKEIGSLHRTFLREKSKIKRHPEFTRKEVTESYAPSGVLTSEKRNG
ncbi:MAG: hypothetical protein ABII96_02030, partial [Candidatus Zixiibacteriota bacterium]